MFLSLLQFFATKFLVLALHLESGSFPRPLSAQEEAEAFAALPSLEQSILILHCVLELADGEIGSLVGMSRSAVQRHRTKTLSELRKQLKALMPKGG